MKLEATQALGGLPQGLRDELLAEYGAITRNYRERRWRYAELDGGRFCEIVYTILKGRLDGGVYPHVAAKSKDLKSDCEALAKRPKTPGSDSLRVTIPRILVGLYQVRNNRDVAHVGGDVDANHMDATYVLYAVKWVMAELVRIFHTTTISEATKVVDALVDRTIPVIWETGTIRRVLSTELGLADKTLLLLYGSDEGVADQDLARDLKQPRLDNYRRVLNRLDADVLVEYDTSTRLVVLSPKGARVVEERILTATDL